MRDLISSGDLMRLFLESDPNTIIRRPNVRRFAQENGVRHIICNGKWLIDNKEFFKKGYYLTDRVDYTRVRSEATRRTLEKLPSYIRYIESEYGVSIYEKTKRKEKREKIKVAYKRTPFLWNQYNWEVA